MIILYIVSRLLLEYFKRSFALKNSVLSLSHMFSWNCRRSSALSCRNTFKSHRNAFQRRRRLSSSMTALTEAVARYRERNPSLLFNPRRGVNGVKAAPPPYLHIKKAIRGTRLCKRRGWPRVPTGDEKNFEIRALINLLSGTATTAVEGGSDEVFVGLSSLSRGLSEAAREFKVLPCTRPKRTLRYIDIHPADAKVAIKNISTSAWSCSHGPTLTKLSAFVKMFKNLYRKIILFYNML